MSILRPHLGDRCAALVDGQLDAAEEERAWQHVLACPGCRASVEQQVAAKQALGGLRAVEEHPRLPEAWLHPDALAAWDQVAEDERGTRRLPARSTLVGVVGGGALTASLAVAVVVGSTAGTATVARPDPGRLGAQLATPATRAAQTQATGWSSPAATVATSAWTGTATGSETSRAFRGDRSD